MPPPPPLPSRRPCSPYLSYSSRFSGFDSTSYAKLISLNLSPAFGFLSGWYSLANFLYAFFSSFSLAPGMVQQMQSVCSDCNGEGEVINEKDRCKKCEGKKVIKEVKILEVQVDKGMKHGQRITFTGEADQAPGVEPGDIVLLLQEKEHEVFQRDGNDLHMTYKIGLVEALCGFQFTFKHLDGHQIVVKYPPGKVIEPGKS